MDNLSNFRNRKESAFYGFSADCLKSTLKFDKAQKEVTKMKRRENNEAMQTLAEQFNGNDAKDSPKPLPEVIVANDIKQTQLTNGTHELDNDQQSNIPTSSNHCVDTESDSDDMEWLAHKTKMLIDDFVDVNEGEKQMMGMWNIHIFSQKFVSRERIPAIFQNFIDVHGEEILEKNLRNNFILHMTNLFDYGLLSREFCRDIIVCLENLESPKK